jgi:hypothetical protein
MALPTVHLSRQTSSAPGRLTRGRWSVLLRPSKLVDDRDDGYLLGERLVPSPPRFRSRIRAAANLGQSISLPIEE